MYKINKFFGKGKYVYSDGIIEEGTHDGDNFTKNWYIINKNNI